MCSRQVLHNGFSIRPGTSRCFLQARCVHGPVTRFLEACVASKVVLKILPDSLPKVAAATHGKGTPHSVLNQSRFCG